MQDVATSVGILKGSLYYYISSKEDLLFGIVERVLAELVPHLERWRTLEGNNLDRIVTFMEEYVLHVIAHRESIGVMFRDFAAMSDSRREKVYQFERQYDTFLADLIEAGQQDGSVAKFDETRLVVNALFGMANWTYRWYRPNGRYTPEEIAKQIASLTRLSLAQN